MKQKSTWIMPLLAAALGFASSAANAELDQYVTVAAGYEYSSGTYGTGSTTDIATAPLSVLYATGPWSMKLTVPYLQVTGDGEIVASGMYRGRRSTTTTVTKARTTQSGLGDIVTMLTYNLYAGENYESGIDLSGRVKFGTASTNLGTGQNDYAVQMFLYHDVAGFTPSIMFGYDMLGSSAQLPLNNVYYGALGSSYKFSPQANTGIEYKYVQKASATSAEQRQAMLYTNFQIVTDLYLRAYLLKGYADGSPDKGYGLTLSAVF